MRFNITINQDKCLKYRLNVNQAALMSLLNEVSAWATEKVIVGKTYYWVSRNEVIRQLPLFYQKPDTVYRHFRDLVELKMIEYVTENRKDFIRLTPKGKLWNQVGNESEFAQKSEMNPSKVGNESEIDNKGNGIVIQPVTPVCSEMNPTNNIYNTTNDNREETALDFLRNNFPSRFEAWMMQNKSRLKDFDAFVNDFNCKIIEEKKPFEADVLFARLTRLSNNWFRFKDADQIKTYPVGAASAEVSPAYMKKAIS